MKYSYDTGSVVCARQIDIETDDQTGVVTNVVFHGGCSGNHQGITALVRGMSPQEVIKRLAGIRCGARSTSCPDQLAEALKEMIAK